MTECNDCGEPADFFLCPDCEAWDAEERRLDEAARAQHEIRMTDDPIYRSEWNRKQREQREMERADANED